MKHRELIIGVAALAAIIALFVWMFHKTKVEVLERQRMSYAAWSKVTGNPARLTFEEWMYLPNQWR